MTMPIRTVELRLMGERLYSFLHRHPSKNVTVIIPCYNYAKYVGKAIESVLNQTLKPRKIIVINDGSTDNSLSVIRKFEKEGIEIISRKNGGVIEVKNQGLKLVKTRWTLFLDADDYLSNDYIEVLCEAAVTEKADVAYTDMKFIGNKQGVYTAGAFSKKKMLEGNFINNSALINTRLMKRVGGYKKEMSGGYEDWELYFSLMEAGAKFIYVPKILLYYRQHSNGASRNLSAQQNLRKTVRIVRRLHYQTYLDYERQHVAQN